PVDCRCRRRRGTAAFLSEGPMVKHRLNRLFSHLFNHHRPVRRVSGGGPRLERLERRDAPAGLISAVLSGGVLSINGLDATVAADSNQQVSILGLGPNSVDVSVGANTQFQGSTDTTLHFKGVTGLSLDMRAGDDAVLL